MHHENKQLPNHCTENNNYCSSSSSNNNNNSSNDISNSDKNPSSSNDSTKRDLHDGEVLWQLPHEGRVLLLSRE